MPLPVLKRLRKRRHRDRTDPDVPRTPKRFRGDGKKPAPPASPKPQPQQHNPTPSRRTGTPTADVPAPSVSLYTPASARTLSPWASSSPSGEFTFTADVNKADPNGGGHETKNSNKDSDKGKGKGKENIDGDDDTPNADKYTPRSTWNAASTKRNAVISSWSRPKSTPQPQRRRPLRSPDRVGRSLLGVMAQVAEVEANDNIEEVILDDLAEEARLDRRAAMFFVEDEEELEDEDEAGEREEGWDQTADTLETLETIEAGPNAMESTLDTSFDISQTTTGGSVSVIDDSHACEAATRNPYFDYDPLAAVSVSTLGTSAPLDPSDRVRSLLSGVAPPTTTQHILSLITPLSRQVSRLQASNNALAFQCGRLEASVDELEGENDDLRAQNRRLMLERRVAEARGRELEREVEALRGKLEMKGEKIVKLRAAMKKFVRI